MLTFKHASTSPDCHLSLARLTTLVCLLVGMIWLALARAGTAQAAGVVGDGTPGSCTSFVLETVINAGSGDISFACGPDPVVINITHTGGLNISSGTYNTIDGGNLVTLTGASTNRLFDVRVNAALTLTNIILTDGYAFSGGNLPDLGGAILAEGYGLVLDNVTIRNSQSQTAGGGLKIIAGTVLVQNSLIEGNYSGIGGGIDNGGTLSLFNTLTLSNTIVRDNHAPAGFGGGLFVSGTVSISNSRIDYNDTGFEGGGIYSLGTLTLSNCTLSGNAASYGGGILNNSGTLALTNCMLNGNMATYGSGGGNGGGIYGYASVTTLNNSTLSGNSASNFGGGIYNSQGNVTLNNSTLSGNSVITAGGGIYSKLGGVILNNSTLNGNQAQQGGGIDNESSSGITLNDSSLSGSTASFGGGMYNLGTATLNYSTLSGNTASTSGGGIDNQGTATLNNASLRGNSAIFGGGMANAGTATLNNSTLSGNRANSGGGGIYDYQGTLALNASTLSGNTATYGGGIWNFRGPAMLTNSTLSGNTASSQGGGVYNGGATSLFNVTASNNAAATGGTLFMTADSAVTTYLTDTILAYSPTGGNCSGSITASKYSIDSDNTCGLAGSGDLYADPLLSALGNYGGPTLVHMPRTGSPAINGVVANDAPNTDQRGKPRPVGPYDIGSVERQLDDSDLAPRLYLPLIVR